MRRVFLAVAVAGVLVVSAGIPSEAVHIGPRTTGGIRSMAPLINCSTPLKLYDGTSLTGATVSVYARGVWINLSGVNFDNRTSSYKVGACSIELATGTNGSGSHYTRCLSAGCEEDTMASGWNNVVSSVYLH